MKLRRSPAFKMSSLSKRELILVVLFLFVLLGGSYYKFIFEPHWSKINKLRSDLGTQQQILSQRKAQGWDDIQSLQEQSRQLREKIGKTYAKVTNIKNEPGLLVDFFKLSVANNLLADTIKFSELKEVDGKGYSTFSISLDFMGRNSDIYKFIQNLEDYSRLNRIAEVKFEPISSHSSKCSLTAEFYVLHEIKPDPLVYPFMAGEYRRNHPYKIFDIYYKLKDIKMVVPAPPGTGIIPAPVPKMETPAPPQVEAPGRPITGGSPPSSKNGFSRTGAGGGDNNGAMIVSKNGVFWYSGSSGFLKGTVVPPDKAR